MEAPSNSTQCPSIHTEILDVEPLRSLAPMLPSLHGFSTFTHPTTPSLVCITPFGPFASCLEPQCPPCLFPLHPTFITSGTANEKPFGEATVNTKCGASYEEQDSGAVVSVHAGEDSYTPKVQPQAFVPLNEHDPLLSSTTDSCQKGAKRTLSAFYEACGAETNACKVKKAKNRSVRRVDEHEHSLLSASSCQSRESVEVILMTFGALWRWLVKLDEMSEKKDLKKHPHLRAGGIMYSNDLRINNIKRIGNVPGIEVGDIFYFRTEMSMIGLHIPNMAGIDYMNSQLCEEDYIAVSIVAAGGYQNEDDDVDTLVYSGQGRPKKKGNQMIDQKLEKGNLALEMSLHRSNVIRVIRTEKDLSSPTGKVYIYDGLYKITESWVDKGKSGTNVFKYKMLREAEQSDGVVVWKNAKGWKENPSSRDNMILPNISLGVETKPVCVVNEVDDWKELSPFSYISKISNASPVFNMGPLLGCMCNGVCIPGPGDVNCSCAQRNGGFLPYSYNGILVSRSSVVYECNANCQCSLNCRNRLTQKGIKLHFEVFRTRDCGWGLRSWDPIRAGTFICEYTGEVLDQIKVDGDSTVEDEYIFQPHAGNKTFKWNHGPELIGEPGFVESEDTSKPLPITISAKNMGNVSRFINHSCSPNIFWQPVLHDHDDEDRPHIMFFAMKHIPPMTELTYDYGLSRPVIDTGQMVNTIGPQRTKKCFCGSNICEGFFG